MKRAFFDAIMPLMEKNKDIYFISAGLGWPRTDELKEKFPKRYIQAEAAEQTALDISVGLSYSGKIPFIYTITPFFYRGWETIRTYINHESLSVKLIGAGRGTDYSMHDGYSHDACDFGDFLDHFGNITQYWPKEKKELGWILDDMLANDKPCFLSLRR